MRRTALLALVLGFVALLPARGLAQTARRPTACDSCIAGWYYFDEDAAGGTQDWNCGASSYDGHRGSDFSLAGGNTAIDMGHPLVAVADGVVIGAEDGHFDHCSTCDASVDARCGLAFGSGFANHVAIDHGGYRAWYAHMRTGSVRVAVGDRVTCGQVIGQIGSSGCTTGAHLHFEPRPPTGGYLTAFDPFLGGCSPRATSLWTSQGPYRGLPGPLCDGMPPPPVCPAGTYDVWTCNPELTQRRRCIAGADMLEDCAFGCRSMPVGVDDVCAVPPDADGDGAAADIDCNDADASINPGATDVCGDSIDQDCAGGDASCGPIDLGISAPDGSTALDGSTSSRDGSAVPLDGGARGGSSTLEGSCGCRAVHASRRGRSALWIAFAALVFWLAQRKRYRQPGDSA